MIDGLVFLVAVVGFAFLMLSMCRHQHDWLRRPLSRRVSLTLRFMGFLLLAVAFAIAGAGLGWAYGAVCWFGWLTAAAATVVLAATNHRRLTHRFSQAGRP